MHALAVELGPEKIRLRGVVARAPSARSPLEFLTLLGADFGYKNTASFTAVRALASASQEVLDFIASEPGKKEVKARLSSHVS